MSRQSGGNLKPILCSTRWIYSLTPAPLATRSLAALTLFLPVSNAFDRTRFRKGFRFSALSPLQVRSSTGLDQSIAC
jgi:hypothetical protein